VSDGVTIWEAEEVDIDDEGFCRYRVAVLARHSGVQMGRCEEKPVQ
jgi:hypothetical protein